MEKIFKVILWALIFACASNAGMGAKVAVMCATDLHCCEPNYPWMKDRINEKSRSVDHVIFAINGDVVTKIIPDPNGVGWIVQPVGPGDSHSDRMQKFEDFLIEVLKNPKVEIVSNEGNHEFMHPEEVRRLLRKMRTLYPNRFYEITNVPVSGGFSGLIQPSVVLHGIRFIGYCTADIYTERGNDAVHYMAARKGGFYICKSGGKPANCPAHNARFQAALESASTPVDVFMFHESRKQIVQYIWPKVKKRDGTIIVAIIGHDHGDWRPNQESTRPYGIFNRQGKGVFIPESNNPGAPVDVFFPGADRVIIPKPFGQSIEVLDFQV
ncbi:MAG: hypothetical protein LBG09_02195 [Puniceicoccales bacterium]|jgi:hypothetical protein|nr:hypothetical protein [Puniceicoccales bacterium]